MPQHHEITSAADVTVGAAGDTTLLDIDLSAFGGAVDEIAICLNNSGANALDAFKMLHVMDDHAGVEHTFELHTAWASVTGDIVATEGALETLASAATMAAVVKVRAGQKYRFTASAAAGGSTAEMRALLRMLQ